MNVNNNFKFVGKIMPVKNNEFHFSLMTSELNKVSNVEGNNNRNDIENVKIKRNKFKNIFNKIKCCLFKNSHKEVDAPRIADRARKHAKLCLEDAENNDIKNFHHSIMQCIFIDKKCELIQNLEEMKVSKEDITRVVNEFEAEHQGVYDTDLANSREIVMESVKVSVKNKGIKDNPSYNTVHRNLYEALVYANLKIDLSEGFSLPGFITPLQYESALKETTLRLQKGV